MLHRREGGEIRKRSRHMCSVPSTTVAAAVLSNGSSANYFVKDGRKINVGDCALFKPGQDSPPFIGLIRSLTLDKESIVRLSVNWLYRPAEVVLGKGVALEAAPNEVFYSFHSDEIPAASLLHPCKVAFLPKGVELPPGVSSFVCRRVYDIANKCLWWLTDQDYIDDHQEEVDQLVHKTRLEMHATVQQQQGVRSPKPVNGSAAMSPLKSSPDSMHNSSSNLSSQTKGRKRERRAQSSEPNKRERSVKADGDSSQLGPENILNLEIAKFAEKGGLVDSEAVERLVQLMQSEKPEQKIDLSGRCSLAAIIAATDNVDCLSQFVQLRGLPVLDEWLQEAHKGKIGDPENIKDGDKSVENFLFVLLRALDKLPVNLNALQMCNIGKSVNHLRSHKNSEIQKKARSLVDRWKKRVEAEININDAKSGSGQGVPWAGRSRCDISHGGIRLSNGSSDAAIRSSVAHHLSLKSAPVKLVQGDSTLKSASAYQGGARSALSPASIAGNLKDGQPRISTNGASSELPLAVVEEEKSCSSNQSHTNSQCSSEHTKRTISSGKEDAKSSTAVSRRLNKLTGSGSKHRKSANGLQGVASSCLQGEAAPSRIMSMGRISAAEKVSNNVTDTSILEGNNHKLIVKIPNRGHCPSPCVAGVSMEDFSCGISRASSPALSEKNDQPDASLRGKHDAHQSNEVDGSSTEVKHRTSNDRRELRSATKVSYLPSIHEMKTRKTLDPAFSSMNALVESCVKFSESNASLSAGDDAGMNLLASVAAGEISTSGIVSPAASGCRNSATPENSCASYIGTKKQQHTDELMKQQCPASNTPDANKQNIADVSNFNDVENSKQSEKYEPLTEESEKKDLRDTALHHSSNDILEKNNVTEQLQSHTSMDQKLLDVASKSEVPDTNEKATVNSSSADLDTTAGKSHDVKSEKMNSVIVEHGRLEANRRSDQENKPSLTLQKHEESGVPYTGKGQKNSCVDKNVDGKEACVYQSSNPALWGSTCVVASQKAEVNVITKGSNLTSVKDEKKGDGSSATTNGALSLAVGVPDVGTKLGFDLNEGLISDDGKSGEPVHSGAGPYSASITVASAAKGAFVPPDDLLRNKRELGWKGSAATSAFRPAEPRKVMEVALGSSQGPFLDVSACKQARLPLDFDLNVADERSLLETDSHGSGEESNPKSNSTLEFISTASLRFSGGFDLDLNKVDETSDLGLSGQRTEIPTCPIKASPSNIFVNSEPSSKRDFDLNNGPATEETHVEQASYNHHSRGSVTFQPPFGPRVSGSVAGNCFAWYPTGSGYSVSMTPSSLPEQEAFHVTGIGNGGQRVIGRPTSSLLFNHDDYKGTVLSSTPAIPFHSPHFQYPVFPFGTSFRLPSSAFPVGSSGYVDSAAAGRISAVPSPSVGNAATVPFQYPQPYVVSRPILDVTNNGMVENTQKWGKQGLDLNSGPGVVDVGGKDESLLAVSRPLSALSSQSLGEEQARLYSTSSGVLKRKEPEGGWNMDKLNFRPSSWQ